MKTLPSLRISQDTSEKMERALSKINSNPFVIKELTISDFRRLAYEVLSQVIFLDKLQELQIKIK